MDSEAQVLKLIFSICSTRILYCQTYCDPIKSNRSWWILVQTNCINAFINPIKCNRYQEPLILRFVSIVHSVNINCFCGTEQNTYNNIIHY